MNKTEIEDIKQTIEWLLHNGDFKDTETAYNSAMNSINTLDEAINFTDSCKQLNVLFAKGDKVIVEDCGKATIIEVISDTTARVKYDNDKNIWTAGLYYLKHQ